MEFTRKGSEGVKVAGGAIRSWGATDILNTTSPCANHATAIEYASILTRTAIGRVWKPSATHLARKGPPAPSGPDASL